MKNNWQENKIAALKKTGVSVILIVILSVLLCNVLQTVNTMNVYAQVMMDAYYTSDIFNALNDISSGRLELWRYFTQDITFFGHGKPDATGLDVRYNWAHNNAIDVLYISGAIAAIGYLIWVLYSLFFVVRCTLKKSCNRPELVFVIVSIIGYFVEAMLEITIEPMNTGIVFMAYISMSMISGESTRSAGYYNHKGAIS